MSHYTSGQLAKEAEVTVRTVQYYDKRNLLKPSALTEGGRRLYREEDLKKLKLICFLRELDFSIDDIKKILREANAKDVLDTLLTSQIKTLRLEVDNKRQKLDKLVKLASDLKSYDKLTSDSLAGISLTMKNNKKWRHMQWQLLTLVLIGNGLFIGLIFLADWLNLWPLGFLGAIFILIFNLYMVKFYYKKVAYLCPNCHKVFRPSLLSFNLAFHTPKTRRLTCPHCQTKSYCVEVYQEADFE